MATNALTARRASLAPGSRPGSDASPMSRAYTAVVCAFPSATTVMVVVAASATGGCPKSGAVSARRSASAAASTMRWTSLRPRFTSVSGYTAGPG